MKTRQDSLEEAVIKRARHSPPKTISLSSRLSDELLQQNHGSSLAHGVDDSRHSRAEQARLASSVRAGGKAFEVLRGRLYSGIEAHLRSMGMGEELANQAFQDFLWNDIWRFIAYEAPLASIRPLLSLVAEHLKRERVLTFARGGDRITPDKGEDVPSRGDSSFSDFDLVRMVREGLASFEGIMRIFQQALLRYILVRIHVPDLDEDDISQLVWAAAWRKLAFSDSYDSEKGGLYCYLYAFLLRKEVSEAVKGLRKKERLVAALCQEWGLPCGNDAGEVETVPQDAGPDDNEDLAEREKRVEALLQLLFRYGGYPHEVLTVVMGKGLYGLDTPRGIAADLVKLESDHGQERLHALVDTFWTEFRRHTSLSAAAVGRVSGYLETLRGQMVESFQCLAERRSPRDAEVLRLAPKPLLTSPVGESPLLAFAWRPDREVTEQMFRWCENVARRLKARLGVISSG